jgi:hypothetical protein
MWNSESEGFGSATDSYTIVKLRSGDVNLCFIACSLTKLGPDGIISSFYAFLALIPWFSTGSMVSLIPSIIIYRPALDEFIMVNKLSMVRPNKSTGRWGNMSRQVHEDHHGNPYSSLHHLPLIVAQSCAQLNCSILFGSM